VNKFFIEFGPFENIDTTFSVPRKKEEHLRELEVVFFLIEI